MSRKKVLFLSSWYPTKNNPTNGDFVQRHAQAVAQLHDVVLLHVAYDRKSKFKQELVISKTNDLEEYILNFSLPKMLAFFKPFFFCFFYVKLFHHIVKQQGKPDVIHANIVYPIGVVAFLFHFIYTIPYVITEHWTGYLQASKTTIPKVKLKLIRFIVKYSSVIITVGRDLQESMQQLGIRGNYIVVNNVVETSIFKPVESWAGLPNRIIHVSSLKEPHKNVTGILRAIKTVSEKRNDFVLDIVSENYDESLISLCKELSIDSIVHFHGKKSRTELASMMQRAVFLLLFSNYETFSCVIIEAFSSGIPVLSTNVVGVKEHITTDKGIMIDCGDEEALVNNIQYLLDHFDQYNAKELHDYAECHFGYNAVSKVISDIYESII